jgi:hypothetical protein
MGAHHPGDPKFEATAAILHGQSEVATINTGHANGIGSRNYEIITVKPESPERHRFSFDKRPTRQRFQKRFEMMPPFPHDRHEGRGYNRLESVDVEAMKRHYEPSVNGIPEPSEKAPSPAND